MGYTIGVVALLQAAGCSVPGWLGPAVEVAGASMAANPDKSIPARNRVDPQLRVSDSQLDFGTIDVSARARRPLEIRNISRFDLKLLTARSSASCFTVTATAAFPITLVPNQATTLSVVMWSGAAAHCEGLLEIHTDSAAAGLVAIRLKGQVGR